MSPQASRAWIRLLLKTSPSSGPFTRLYNTLVQTDARLNIVPSLAKFLGYFR